jgi:phosphoribosyl-ATP pyrophosphohydrolase/phosphoribosyl-AMP cyclohydrolase
MLLDLDALDFEKGKGLVSVVAQDARTGQVLMQAFANREALQRTLDTGEMHYQSRSRGLWHKGATSGNTQRVVSLTADCDGDAVLARVIPAGPSCHTGAVTCFGDQAAETLAELDAMIDGRDTSPPGDHVSYTTKLLRDRNLRLKKIGEEAAEFVTACADADTARATEEAADLMYHMLVALHAAGGSLNGVREVLRDRR